MKNVNVMIVCFRPIFFSFFSFLLSFDVELALSCVGGARKKKGMNGRNGIGDLITLTFVRVRVRVRVRVWVVNQLWHCDVSVLFIYTESNTGTSIPTVATILSSTTILVYSPTTTILASTIPP